MTAAIPTGATSDTPSPADHAFKGKASPAPPTETHRRASENSNSSHTKTASTNNDTNSDGSHVRRRKRSGKAGSVTSDSSRGSNKGNGILRNLRRSSWGTTSDHDTSTDQGDKPGEGRTARATVDDEAQKRQDRKVCMLRGAMITTLLTATAVVATLAFVYVRSDEQGNFENQYMDSVAKVAEAFQNGIDKKHDSASTFSAMYTSRYGNDAHETKEDNDHEQNDTGFISVWPNATMPDFQEQAEGQLKLANGRALSFNPIITQDVDRLQWEAHATESAWILGDESLITPDPSLTWPDNRTVSFGIYSRDSNGNVVYDPGYAESSRFPYVLVPVWQIAPIETNQKAVMFNLHWEGNRQRALDDMLMYRVPALTAILQLVQDKELRPSSILFYPVFDEFNYEIDNIERKVTGSVSIVFSWDTLLASILPDYIKGMICVLRSSTDQEYSYSISGDKVTLLGEGDLHDPKYNDMGRTVKANLGKTEDLLGEVDYLITYQLEIYPSQEFEDQYVTNRPAIYTAGVVLIFLCTAALFLLYDYLVEDRQQKTVRLARQTGNIVDSMFPAAFRDRLYKSHNNTDAVSRSSSRSDDRRASDRRGSDGEGTVRASNISIGASGEGRKSSLTMGKMNIKEINKFMKNNMKMTSDQNPMGSMGQPSHSLVEDEPIADLFLDTSIMFSDIVGFTNWSSERSPNEVFRLLEHLFWEFDAIAAKMDVFKLGTIGDCYIAVTGIPNPIDDHAIVLSRFAFECREKVRQVKEQLESEGLETSKLDMRFGIHSGAITAGILRGTKSRFELFGDTINTASRMESTGQAGRIQVSEETAELLRLDHKERWLTKREDLVFAKGKGDLQTYWVEPSKEGNRVSFSELAEDRLTEATIKRLSSSSKISDSGSDRYYQVEYGSSEKPQEEKSEEIDPSEENVGIGIKSEEVVSNGKTGNGEESRGNSKKMSADEHV